MKKRLMALVMATVMMFTLAASAGAVDNDIVEIDLCCADTETNGVESASSGCGRAVQFAGRLGVAAGGMCFQQGGPSNCILSVMLDAYRCNPSCHGSDGYCGAIYVCNGGHVIKNVGQVMGVCS
jgi:hypothetical protein